MAKPLDLSIIIPVAPGADPAPAIRAVARDLPRGVTAEIITVAGTHPTRQRNLAAMKARGRALYFLDHDSIVQPGTVGRLMHALRTAVVAGGPNLAAAARTRFEELASLVIGSRAGSPGVSSRYHADGPVRPASERALILCNLMVRRDVFLAAGGFDPRLYPNEENEMMNRLSGEGLSLLQVPTAPVRKPRPESLLVFLRESFRYGRGRAEQIWVNGQWSDAPYAGASAILVWLLGWAVQSPRISVWILLLWVSCAIHSLWSRVLVVPALGAVRLVSYACGMLAGGITGIVGRRIRLVPLTIVLKRIMLAPAFAPKLVEEHVFNIGSWSKEVPARA